MDGGTTTTGMPWQGSGPIGGNLTDLVSTQKGGVQNIGQLVKLINTLIPATLGATPGGTTSPKVTIATAVGTTSALVIAANSARLTINFHSPNPNGNNMWVAPSTMTAVAGQGILVLPGATVPISSTCGWNAIATTGSANVLTIIEFS